MSEINRLKSELKKCIKEENYEQAAVIRDQINKLEGGSSK
ncbi:UvrB/UvrC motif-containing protein [uncultured Dialister sp.]|nr:UvrB/UvrC motif-containing protein [uncultured Dialister sp.]